MDETGLGNAFTRKDLSQRLIENYCLTLLTISTQPLATTRWYKKEAHIPSELISNNILLLQRVILTMKQHVSI